MPSTEPLSDFPLFLLILVNLPTAFPFQQDTVFLTSFLQIQRVYYGRESSPFRFVTSAPSWVLPGNAGVACKYSLCFYRLLDSPFAIQNHITLESPDFVKFSVISLGLALWWHWPFRGSDVTVLLWKPYREDNQPKRIRGWFSATQGSIDRGGLQDGPFGNCSFF